MPKAKSARKIILAAACIALTATGCTASIDTTSTGFAPSQSSVEQTATAAPATAPSDSDQESTENAPPPAKTAQMENGTSVAESMVLVMLNNLTVRPEHEVGYNRDDFGAYGTAICDNPGTDPYTGLDFDADSCEVEHIVALKEAHESGAHEWTDERKDDFGDTPINLIPARDCVNGSKSNHDIAEWVGVIKSGPCAGTTITPQGRCFWAYKTVEIKTIYGLAVDTAEKVVLADVLSDCAHFDLAAPINMGSAQPSTTAPTAISGAGTSDCHPAYKPCLPNLAGDVLNCGDLEAHQKPVTVIEPGTDPYRLDADGDGFGCGS